MVKTLKSAKKVNALLKARQLDLYVAKKADPGCDASQHSNTTAAPGSFLITPARHDRRHFRVALIVVSIICWFGISFYITDAHVSRWNIALTSYQAASAAMSDHINESIQGVVGSGMSIPAFAPKFHDRRWTSVFYQDFVADQHICLVWPTDEFNTRCHMVVEVLQITSGARSAGEIRFAFGRDGFLHNRGKVNVRTFDRNGLQQAIQDVAMGYDWCQVAARRARGTKRVLTDHLFDFKLPLADEPHTWHVLLDFCPRPGNLRPLATRVAKVVCPSGWVQLGNVGDDVPGCGLIGCIAAPSIASCASQCEAEAQCASFEYSPSKKICGLNSATDATTSAQTGSWGDLLTCKKGLQSDSRRAECPKNFLYASKREGFQDTICYNNAASAEEGIGECGQWCTLEIAVGEGCGDNFQNLCYQAPTPVPTPAPTPGLQSDSRRAECPKNFLYASKVEGFQDTICYNNAASAEKGTGGCGQWCTLDIAVGEGCGDNFQNLCYQVLELSVAVSAWQWPTGALSWENTWDLWVCIASLLTFGMQGILFRLCYCTRISAFVAPLELDLPISRNKVLRAPCLYICDLQWFASLLGVVCLLLARFALGSEVLSMLANLCALLVEVATLWQMNSILQPSCLGTDVWKLCARYRGAVFMVFLCERWLREVAPHSLSILLSGGSDTNVPEHIYPFIFEYCNVGASAAIVFVVIRTGSWDKLWLCQRISRSCVAWYFLCWGAATPASLVVDPCMRQRCREGFALLRMLALTVLQCPRQLSSDKEQPMFRRHASKKFCAAAWCSLTVSLSCFCLAAALSVPRNLEHLVASPPRVQKVHHARPVHGNKICNATTDDILKASQEHVSEESSNNEFAHLKWDDLQTWSFSYLRHQVNNTEWCPSTCDPNLNVTCGRCIAAGNKLQDEFPQSHLFEVINVFYDQGEAYFYGDDGLTARCGTMCYPTWENWPDPHHSWYQYEGQPKKASRPEIKCSLSKMNADPVLLVRWMFPENVYHFYTDSVLTTFMTVGLISKVLGCSREQVQVYVVAGFQATPFEEIWSTLFGTPANVISLNGCFSKAFYGHLQRNVAAVNVKGLVFDPILSSWAVAWRLNIRSGLIKASVLNTTHERLLFVHHHRAPDWFYDVDWCVPGVEIDFIDFGRLTYIRQINSVAASRGLIGMSGAGLEHHVFLPPGSVVGYVSVVEAQDQDDEKGENICWTRMSREDPSELQEEQVALCHAATALHARNTALMWRWCRPDMFNDTSAFTSRDAQAVLKLLLSLRDNATDTTNVQACLVLDGDTSTDGWPRCDQRLVVPSGVFVESCSNVGFVGLPYNSKTGSSSADLRPKDAQYIAYPFVAHDT